VAPVCGAEQSAMTRSRTLRSFSERSRKCRQSHRLSLGWSNWL